MSRYPRNSLLVCCIVMVGFSSAIVGDDGADHLDLKQKQVVELSNQAVDNYIHRCELLATCDNPSNCSHSSCGPLKGDLEGFTCTAVVNSTYCPAPGNGNTPCKSMNLDYTQGYVRVAKSTKLDSMDTMLSICSQRKLDPLMQSFTPKNPSNLTTRSYFGSMDGSWRVLPGTPRSEEDCLDFDPRPRPWFRTSTSVVKVVTILIDLAASMNSNLPPSVGAGSILQVAKNIASQLLTTLSAGDHVNVVVFNSKGAYQLLPEAILVQDHLGTIQPELQPLLDELNNQTVESQYGQSNLTAAILAALPSFESNREAAKVIVVLTDGFFASLGNITLPSANLSGVKLFLYKLPWSNDKDLYLTKNTLTQQLCAVGGHFELIMQNLENPLLVLTKYFSYLANLKRIETGGSPQYSAIYEEFERLGGNITTLSMPTFSSTGDLIGVAGITIYLDLMGNLTNLVKNALRTRVTGYSTPTKPIVLSTANCTLTNETTQPCGTEKTYYAKNGGLCEKTLIVSSIQNLACCGLCSISSHSSGSDQKSVIVGAVMGSFGFVLLLGIAFFVYRFFKNKNQSTYSSDNDEYIDPSPSHT